MSDYPLLLIITGALFSFVALAYSATRFVAVASRLAYKLGISQFVIGMVVIGFGTSAPELSVSVFAAVFGSDGIALGNAYGSNIANIGLGIGIAAIIFPLTFNRLNTRFDALLLMGVSILTMGALYDLRISRLEGVILLFISLAHLVYSFFPGRKHNSSHEDELKQLAISPSQQATGLLIIFTVFWLIILVLSSTLLVETAKRLAFFAGLSEAVIGLTLTAIGTSLPEIASTISASLHRNAEAVLGNIIGSCLFNTLMVIGAAATIVPLSTEKIVFVRDLPVMLVFTLVLTVLCINKSEKISRPVGGILIAGYIGYFIVIGGTELQWM